ncbi:MAG TPA: signal recognition particle-docking protein FtsY [Solirubrobacterales bacterium]|nr:signal recognition particle-docking protein FtsY [Solirubrobacterales bacterium]
MPTTWTDLIEAEPGAELQEPPGEEGEDSGEPQAKRRGVFRRLRESLATSREALSAELSSSLFETLDAETWERLEEALIMADVGARTTAEVVSKLELEVESGKVTDGEAVRERLIELLAELARVGDTTIDVRKRPAVVLVVGVNGTGKTTTIGKLASRLRSMGLSVLLAAGDTYRAAAVEQLTTWAERAECEIVRAETGQDAGAVIFDAIERAEARAIDVVLIDTAGRLHTRTDLMDELAKVNRVIAKRLGGPPAETLIVVDSTTGQNGLRQAKIFSEAVEVDGVVLTKLDGTAKGGIALAIAGELGIPVKLIGVGEGIDDLRPFDADEFAAALLGD